MANYRFPPPGENDPIMNIHHYVGTRIEGDIRLMRGGEEVNLRARKHFFSGLLRRYADGTYVYPHTESFNPEVALRLRAQVLATLKPDATVRDLEYLTETLFSAMDKYAIEAGRPNKTREAIQEFIETLKDEAKSK